MEGNWANLLIHWLSLLQPKDIPLKIFRKRLEKHKLMNRFEAYRNIHFPTSTQNCHEQSMQSRIKFEELFIAQVRLNLVRLQRHKVSKGWCLKKWVIYFNTLYSKYLPFELTGAQKRVIKEIRNDTGRGHQMNRLLQGDVGSGKTIVAFLSMLLAADNGYQSCLMAPTEILAQQHYTRFE